MPHGLKAARIVLGFYVRAQARTFQNMPGREYFNGFPGFGEMSQASGLKCPRLRPHLLRVWIHGPEGPCSLRSWLNVFSIGLRHPFDFAQGRLRSHALTRRVRHGFCRIPPLITPADKDRPSGTPMATKTRTWRGWGTRCLCWEQSKTQMRVLRLRSTRSSKDRSPGAPVRSTPASKDRSPGAPVAEKRFAQDGKLFDWVEDGALGGESPLSQSPLPQATLA